MVRARRATAATCRCWCPTSAASTGPWSSGARHIAIFGSRHRDLRAARTSTAAWTSSSRCSSRPSRRARDAGLDVRAYVSMCFGDPWEGDVPVDQVVGGRQAAVRPRRQPAQPRRHDRRRHRRARHGAGPRLRRRRDGADQLALHFHDTYGQALANAYAGAAGRHHDVRRQRRRARRLPLRQERDRQPRHRGPGVDADRPRDRDRGRPRRRWSPPASGWRGTSAGPARPRSSGRWPGAEAGTAQSAP